MPAVEDPDAYCETDERARGWPCVRGVLYGVGTYVPFEAEGMLRLPDTLVFVDEDPYWKTVNERPKSENDGKQKIQHVIKRNDGSRKTYEV